MTRVINCIFFLCLFAAIPASFAQGKAAQQKATDDKLLAEYFAKYNITPSKTRSGLYYVIGQKGEGNTAMRGQTVSVNYTGKTLDGKVFDSNLDPEFRHVEPLVFEVGMGRVIKGWDEGLMLLNAGSKATLYIPSGLAYGERAMADKIAPNSILVFDVQLLSIEK